MSPSKVPAPQSPELPEPLIVGYFEIASRTGVRRPVITLWRQRHEDFPTPLQELQIGPVWLWQPVKQWLLWYDRPIDANWSWEQVMGREKGLRPFDSPRS